MRPWLPWLRFPLAALGFLGILAPPAAGIQRLTQQEALGLAFPEADTIHRNTAYLDAGQLALIGDLAGAGAETPSSVVPYYVAFSGGQPMGVAYFDAHRVRTLDEVLMVVVGLDARILRVETVAFREPPEYEAPEGWLSLFEGRELDGGLSLKGDIPNITGATLTADAVTRAVRRVLALHGMIAPFGREGEEDQ